MKPDAVPYRSYEGPQAQAAPSRLADLIVLAKVRVNALVVATTAGGYYMAAPRDTDFLALGLACAGTALVASGASAFNQVHERDTDKLMVRTRLRPVADGRMTPAEGLTIAAALSIAGLLIIWLGANRTAAAVALVTLGFYALVYTPMKRRSSLATIVGAVPGALPPLIGWSAAGATLASPAPWALFFVMFLWQLPHFLAIAWIYREDYGRAGLPMLPVVDQRGALTGRQAVLWAATMIPFSLLPTALHMTDAVYAVGASVLGIAQLIITVRFALQRTDARARVLFYASITYLPLLWLLVRGPAVTAYLPTLNAILNGTSAILLSIGWWHIKHRRIATHRRFMIAAFTSSALFLTFCTVYHAQIGSKPYPGTGIMRTVYFSILIPHVVLAAAVLPLALVTLRRGLKRDDARHRKIAKVTLPLWLFVSVTGVVVYLMLYR